VLTGDQGGSGTYDETTGRWTLSFNTAPAVDDEIQFTYNYYSELPIVGVLNYYKKDGTEKLLAVDTKRMAVWDTTDLVFKNAIESDVWDGASKNFIWDWMWNDIMYMTNGVQQIQQYDNATLSPFNIDIDGAGAANDVSTCKFILAHKSRLLIFAPTEATDGVCPQRVRWCKVNDPTDWTQDEYVDADTLQWIVTAEFLGDDIIVFFERSIWKLRYTADDDLPFVWEKILDTEGAYARFSIGVFSDELIALGPTGLIATDGMDAYTLAKKLPDFTLSTATDKLEYAYNVDLDEMRQMWLSYVSPAQSLPSEVLCYNYEELNWSIFDLAFLTFGYYTIINDLTWDTAGEIRNDEEERAWDDKTTQAGYPLTLAGDNTGTIWRQNEGVTDNGAAINFTAISGRWNPYTEAGREARLGWIDFLVDTDASATFTVDFYKDTSPSAYKTVSVSCAGTHDKTWMHISIGEVAAFHQIKITHAGAQQIRIHAILPFFKRAGRLV